MEIQSTTAALELALEALEHSKPTMSHYPEPIARHAAAIKAVRAALAPGDIWRTMVPWSENRSPLGPR